jgi:thioredoxin 1
MKNVTEVTDATFAGEVLRSDLPILVDFWAPWCGPCRMMGPVIESTAAALDGKIKFAKVNTDENVEFAGQYGIMAIPTMILFHKGEEKDRFVGYIARAELESSLLGHHEKMNPPAVKEGPSCQS